MENNSNRSPKSKGEMAVILLILALIALLIGISWGTWDIIQFYTGA